MDIKKELIGLRIYTGLYFLETQKTWGESTVKALLNRMGQKSAEIVADRILDKYSNNSNKNENSIQNNPSVAFSLFQNTITKLFDTSIISQEDLEDKYVIKIKNICIYRQVIKNRKEIEYGGNLCEFSSGYFETALKKISGMNVEYKFNEPETTDEFCTIDIVFYKNLEEKG